MEGCHGSEDLTSIGRLIGRIPGIRHDVIRVQCVWERMVAARVELAHCVVFCVKTGDGRWSIVDIAVYEIGGR